MTFARNIMQDIFIWGSIGYYILIDNDQLINFWLTFFVQATELDFWAP